MHLYVASKGQRLGPFSVFRVIELLDDGELTPNDLGWHAGRDEWTPLREIPSLMSNIEAKRERDFLHESGKSLDTKQADKTNAGDEDGGGKLETTPSEIGSPKLPPVPATTGEKAAAKSAARASATSTFGTPRPIRRFWARIFDYLLVIVAVYFIAGPPPFPGADGSATVSDIVSSGYWDQVRESAESPEFKHFRDIHLAAVILWVILEGLLIAQFGATPGKWLFAIRVRNADGTRLTPLRSLARALLVWFAGVGLWILPLTLATMGFALYTLLSRRTTIWDANLKCSIEHGKLTPLRLFLVIFAFFAIFALQAAALQ